MGKVYWWPSIRGYSLVAVVRRSVEALLSMVRLGRAVPSLNTTPGRTSLRQVNELWVGTGIISAPTWKK